MKPQSLITLLLLTLCIACQPNATEQGIVKIFNADVESLLDPSSRFDTLATGLNWSEGPLYLPGQKSWIFSDVPENKIYQIDAQGEIRVYLEPSGHTDSLARGGETGSNGLLLNNKNELVLMQHGDRRVAKMQAPLDAPAPVFSSLIDRYEGLQFNSPNDGVFDKEGNLYFTDPPYGLEYNMDDPTKEIPFQGVYCLLTSGELLLVDSLSRPNGVVLSPNEDKLIVAVSDPAQTTWYQYPILKPGKVGPREVYFDVTDKVGKPGEQGLPDGMKMHPKGYLFASGPGGVWVFREKQVMARIYTGQATSNCAFSDDWKTLLITADGYIFALPIK